MRRQLQEDPKEKTFSFIQQEDRVTFNTLQFIREWFVWLCGKNDGVGEINLPSTRSSCRASLALRRTAVSLGMDQCVRHVGDMVLKDGEAGGEDCCG